MKFHRFTRTNGPLGWMPMQENHTARTIRAAKSLILASLASLLPLWLLAQATPEKNMTNEETQKMAQQRDAEAQFKLGEMYRYGEGVEQDWEKAAHWYRKAAEQGHAAAQFGLAGTYSTDVKKARSKQAEHWYRKAAEQGHVGAQSALAALYEQWGEYQQARMVQEGSGWRRGKCPIPPRIPVSESP
ncbi:MAG: tetratricopeptide repeat protein [Sphingobacteriia bacterium]|jgi:TPR repeat protein